MREESSTQLRCAAHLHRTSPNHACDFASAQAASAARAFTLTEMLVAVAVLVMVIIATSKIFGTASQITAVGGATQAIMQDAAAIEQQLRHDIDHLTQEGFMVIRCVAVRNDINSAAGGPLLHPNLPPNALVRADQLLFFANGVESMQTLRMGEGSNKKPQGTASRIYYGPAFQLLRGQGVVASPTGVLAHDPGPVAVTAGTNAGMSDIFPWRFDAPTASLPMVHTLFTTDASTGTNAFLRTAPSSGIPTAINATQPPATRRILARQAVALVDDDSNANDVNSKTEYLLQGTTARSIFIDHTGYGHTREIRNGRVDGAATLLNEIRLRTLSVSPTLLRPWNGTIAAGTGGDQRRILSSAVYYPRAERVPPISVSSSSHSGVHRVDQALTNHVISSACSSFIVEWTYDDRTGEVDLNRDGTPEYFGVRKDPRRPQPWFGLSDVTAQVISPAVGGFFHPTAQRGVGEYREPAYQAFAGFIPAQTIPGNTPTGATPTSTNLERNNASAAIAPFGQMSLTNPVAVYEALFGYNQNQPLDPATGAPWPDTFPAAVAYTPLPSSLRITMVLHDPNGRLENGREFQFVIDLPKRGR